MEEQTGINIDIEICKGCGLCIAACPEDLLKLSREFNTRGNQFAQLNENGVCTGCGLCALMCPDCAIKVFRVSNER